MLCNKNFTRCFVKISLLLLIFVGGAYLAIAIYIAKNAEIDTKTESDAILVLGARAYREGAYNQCLLARVSHAVDLYKEKYAPKILVSGGIDKKDKASEAETMKKIAMLLGVPVTDILVEPASMSTYQNFVFSKKILEANHLNSVIVVTEPFHAPRAALIAKKLGVNYTISSAINSPCWLQHKYFSHYFLKEPLAIGWYWFRGRV